MKKATYAIFLACLLPSSAVSAYAQDTDLDRFTAKDVVNMVGLGRVHECPLS